MTFHALGVVKRRHQGSRDTSPAERLGVEERLVRECDRVVATCSDEVFELLRLGGDRRRISVVPCGVDLSTFTPSGPAEERTPGRHRLVYVGRLVERKGIGNAISALAGLVNNGGPDTELVVAGGPDAADVDTDPEVRRLRALARKAHVEDRVHVRGRVGRAELPALLRSADAVVCVPWYEPFGIVPLEAMACGVPVVASAVGGIIDSVVDGKTGVHVPPRRPDVVAEVLRDLLPDEARRAAYGAAGAARARARYSWTRVAGTTLGAYEHLLPMPAADMVEEEA
jgi:glycosyltransferase involved in cell wall biosynthesis